MDALKSQLIQNVQYNCDISDARYARDYSMCVYLLRMQEHYRWKNAIPLNCAVKGETLGDWVRETEDYWDTIEETDFQPVTIGNQSFDPFDTDKINRALAHCSPADSSLAYTAGIGRLGQPHFVLAECVQRSTTPYPQMELGQELARDSITMPALSRDGTIIIRHDSIKRMLWQMIAEWRLRKPDGPMARLLTHYQINDNPSDAQITSTARDLSTLLIQHERGEIMAKQISGKNYLHMLTTLQGKPAEGYIRAVGDLLADSLSTWPYLVEQQAGAHLDFWLAGLQGIRESILKPTAIAEKLLTSTDRLQELSLHIEPEQKRWAFVAQQLITSFERDGARFDYKSVIQQATRLNP